MKSLKENKLKSVLYIGSYYKQYSRNNIFIKGLKRNNINIYEYNLGPNNILKNLVKFIKDFNKLKKLDFDLIILFSHVPIKFIFVKILAKLLSRIKKKPLVDDIFISKLQTFILDREIYTRSKLSHFIRYILYFCLDFIDCFLADFIFLDTYSHIKFFKEKFKVPTQKFRRILVGVQDDIFYPLENNNKSSKFKIGFWGSFIPLHGVRYIIESAKLLESDEEIIFILIGDGQTYNENKQLAKELNLKNIRFIRNNFMISNRLERLPKLISTLDFGLGIFGNSNKTLQVIPNKIYEGLAMKIPMITANTPAIREEFTDNKNIILCERANPISLARNIVRLKNDEELRKRITIEGYLLYKNRFSIDKIGLELVNILNEILTKYNNPL